MQKIRKRQKKEPPEVVNNRWLLKKITSPAGEPSTTCTADIFHSRATFQSGSQWKKVCINHEITRVTSPHGEQSCVTEQQNFNTVELPPHMGSKASPMNEKQSLLSELPPHMGSKDKVKLGFLTILLNFCSIKNRKIFSTTRSVYSTFCTFSISISTFWLDVAIWKNSCKSLAKQWQRQNMIFVLCFY